MKITFSIEYHTKWGESLCLVSGNERYHMNWQENDIWSVTIPACPVKLLKDYFYVVIYDNLIVRSEWEHHSSKAQSEIRDDWKDCPIQGCPFPRKHSAAIFDRPGFRGAGTAIPIFSLRTPSDFGIGEFRDLHPIVDWAAATGQCILQLLPINDTTRKGGWDDSYPYSPISSFALNPLYIHLQDIGVKEDTAFKKKQKSLNALSELDYPKVFEAKMALVRKAFLETGEKDMAGKPYQKFIKENGYWLKEYSNFCARRDSLEPEYYCWMQYHLDKQLSEEVRYAHSKGIYLKGDLPIGVSRDSAEAYYHPELFFLDSSAGAPPDYFSTDGQNWGFPTYNWDEMAKDNFAWWSSRLKKMAEYFDAFRIDHILGFFRIWEIPVEHKSGIEGHFNPAMPYSVEEIRNMGLPLEGLFHPDPRHPGMYQPYITPASSNLEQWQQERFGALYNDFFFHRHDEFWRRNAEKKLPELLNATGMLACGEDLGMVPDCVPGVMDHEKILSLEMEQMDKGRPWPYLSVCATSSHDMDTIRMQHQGGDLEAWECRNILQRHLDSGSMLAVFPLQDWLSIDAGLRRKDYENERINYPADSHNHWKFRIHLDLNELKTAAEFNAAVEGMIKDSGRRSTL